MTSSEHFELCMFSIGMGTILMLVFGWFFIVPFASWINARIDRYRAVLESVEKGHYGSIEKGHKLDHRKGQFKIYP